VAPQAKRRYILLDRGKGTRQKCLSAPNLFSGGLGPEDGLRLALLLCPCSCRLAHTTTTTSGQPTGVTTQRRPLVLTLTILRLVVLNGHGHSARPVDTERPYASSKKREKYFMHSNNFRCLVSKRNLLAALVLGPLLLSGCAHTGGTAGQAVPSANPARYSYNPASRDFETRWPFGPANYH
jgi:hypothetical protein